MSILYPFQVRSNAQLYRVTSLVNRLFHIEFLKVSYSKVIMTFSYLE